jgi:prefoldin subunit 5
MSAAPFGQKSEDAEASTKDAIPTAVFIEDMDAYMKREGSPAAALEKLQKLYQAFKFIEQRLSQKKAKLKIKLPEITKTYNALCQMEEQSKLGEPLISHYELAQSIYAKAKINVHEDDKVCLWLGANVMLEYPRAEAIELLGTQQKDAKTALNTVIDDMGFLRDQITTTEVNMARVFNWDVKERRKQKEAEAKGVEVS